MKTSLLIFILMASLCAPVMSQDEGIPDTVRIEGDTLQVGVSIPVRVAVANDNTIRSFFFGLVSRSLDGGFARVDSVVFVNRMANPGVLEWRVSYFRDSNGVTPDSTLVAAMTVANPIYLPPGNDALFDVYLTGLNPGMMVVDSGWFPPGGSFSLTPNNPSGPQHYFVPIFATDTLTIIQGSPPPIFALPEDNPSTEAGRKVSFNVEAESPENNVVTIELVDLTPLEGGGRNTGQLTHYDRQ